MRTATVEPLPVTGLKVEVPTVIGDRTVKFRWKRGKCDKFIVEGLKGDPADEPRHQSDMMKP